MAIDDYSVSRSTRVCGKSGRVLEPQELCVATLQENDEGELERVDYAIEAWSEDDRPQRLMGIWRTKVPEASGPRRTLVDDEALLDIFTRLDGETNRDRQAFRYVLALVLLRKRLLRFHGRRRDGDTEIWLMHPRGDSESPPLEVIDPALGEDDIVAVHEQLGEILHGELA
ncbi:MAG: hypothetical protein MK101_07435 [Phycisphaerales bacterium]|nr:hypothetical protein [Phycisphaerales bacterium]